MIILIPIGGVGERFKKNNYNTPKALINVFGKPILYYILDNLIFENNDYIIYIAYNKEYLKYRFEERLIKDYPDINFKFHCLLENTSGAAETINIALNNLKLPDQEILCLDSDNFYTTNIINIWNKKNSVITIKDTNVNPIYSYVKENNNIIADIREKEKISDFACTGAYGFSSYFQLKKYSKIIIDSNIKIKNEYYTSLIIKEMINDNIEFKNIKIDKKFWHCLGTPIQLRHFYHNYPKISSINSYQNIKELRICFDLDNTLVSFPKIKNDYSSVEPIYDNINLLKYLKKFGHTIIIYTARRMKTHKGNLGKINADIGKITFDTLSKFDIPFDEIYFGKPYADVYIDDLAINCFHDIQKELGFYDDIISPRDFNSISNDIISCFTKKSNDLSGEIYYYNNIPRELKDLFPLLINYDDNNKWYTMEKIEGLTVTNLYLSELLTLESLKHIMNSIKRIHSCNYDKKLLNDLNIYENYTNKIKNRYLEYDYSKYNNSENIYNILINKLTEYEKNNKGIPVIIHGDPVMTNIIINDLDKIKFIDMRGKIGNNLTILGDSLYDWAKLYQSLIGYDKILLNKSIDFEYEKKFIIYFKNYFINKYSSQNFNNLKLITKSLIFSLIPLHNNSNYISDLYQLLNSEHLN